MVQYLGLDYVEHAINEQRNFLARALLAVPQHLEVVDGYVHNGEQEPALYRSPWLRAPVNRVFLSEEKNITLDHLKSLNLMTEDGVEPFQDGSRSQAGVFDLFEVVPSSNPNSQDSLADFDIMLTTGTMGLNRSEEDFEKENLHALDSHKKTDISWEIEEIVSDDYQNEAVRNVPSLSLMSSRLQPCSVKDPLLNKDGKSLTQEDIFKHLEMKQRLDQSGKTTRENVENFSKFENYEILEDKALEEMLSPVANSSEKTAAIETLTKEQIDRCIADEDYQLDLEGKKLVHCDIHQETVLAVEKNPMTPITLASKTFLELNEIGREQCVSNAFLDSPVISMRQADKEEVEKPTVTSIVSPGVAGSPIRVFTPKSKYELEEKIWQHEKYFDDILTLRFTEPVIKSKGLESEVPFSISAKHLLNLDVEKDVGSVELNLSWDILSFSMSRIVQYKSIESPSGFCDDTSVMKQKPVEDFTKISIDELSDLSDMEIEQNEKMAQVEKPSAVLRSSKEPLKHKHTVAMAKQRLLNVSVGQDPLSDFLMMRAAKTFPEADTVMIDKVAQNNVVIPSPARKKSKMESKIELIQVQLTDKFKYVLRLLEDSASASLAALKYTGDLLPSQSVCTMNSQQSKFLMKQKEKYLKDNKEGVTGWESYRAFVILHSIVVSVELLTHCCLEAAIDSLSMMQDKHQSVLRGSLEEIRQKLFHLNYTFHQEKLHHPKVVTLCRKVESWIEKKKVMSPGEDVKILVILKRDMKSLTSCLRETLNIGGLIKPVETADLSIAGIEKRVDVNNCLLLNGDRIDDDFPWARFSFVVEYEYQEGKTDYKDLCEKQNIQYIGLVVTSPESVQSKGMSTASEDELLGCDTYRPVMLLGSHSLTEKTKLLQLLETRYNILIVERDFRKLQMSKKIHFADMIIDERTAIVLHPLSEFEENWQLEPLTTRLVCMSLKYLTCIIILHSFEGRDYSHSRVNGNIYKLHAALVNFTSKEKEFDIKVLICHDATEVADSMRRVIDQCMDKSQVWKQKDWQNRGWITEHMSMDEKLLISMPCFNSFSAQLVLKQMSLSELMTSSLQTLATLHPWFPIKVLKAFRFIANCNAGLELRKNREVLEDSNHDVQISSPSNGRWDIESENKFVKCQFIPSEYRQNQQTLEKQNSPHTESGMEEFSLGNHIDGNMRIENRKSKILQRLGSDRGGHKRFRSDASTIQHEPSRKSATSHSNNENSYRDCGIALNDNGRDSEDFLELSGSSQKANQFVIAEREGQQWKQQHSMLNQTDCMDRLEEMDNGSIQNHARYSVNSTSVEEDPNLCSVTSTSMMGDYAQNFESISINHCPIRTKNSITTADRNLRAKNLSETVNRHCQEPYNNSRSNHVLGELYESNSLRNCKSNFRMFDYEERKDTLTSIPGLKQRPAQVDITEANPGQSVYTKDLLDSRFEQFLRSRDNRTRVTQHHLAETSRAPKNRIQMQYSDCIPQHRMGADKYIRNKFSHMQDENLDRKQFSGYQEDDSVLLPMHRTNNSATQDIERGIQSARSLFQDQVPMVHRPFSNGHRSQFRPPPVHRVSIGLAQPRRRQTDADYERGSKEKGSQEGQVWTNEDSPPMDLDMQPTSPIKVCPRLTGNNCQDRYRSDSRQNKMNNTMVCTSDSTGLNKKRKLTFQKTPRSMNGQTKLVFK